MKILFLVSSMHGGGAERVAANLVEAWVKRGDDVTLVVTFSGRGECVYPMSDSVKLIFLADLVKNSKFKFLSRFQRLLILRNIAKEFKPDVILSFLTNVNIAALVATVFLKIPVVVAEHSYPPEMTLKRTMEATRRIVYSRASCVVMLTSKGLDWLRNEIPNAVGAVIPNPVIYPLPMVEPIIAIDSRVQVQRKVLLAVGRLDEGKQFSQLLDAYSALVTKYQDWDLVILGEGPDRPLLEQRLNDLRIRDRAFLIGRVGNVGSWYQRADLYVMSSRFEGFPNTLIEAMSYGCAAVSYDCDTGPRDIIRNEVDGLLVNPVGNVQALTFALDRLMADEHMRSEMALKATEVRERFALEVVVELWDRIFASSGVRM